MQGFDFGHQQRTAAGDGRELGDRVGRSLGAMRGGEGVVDEYIAQRSHTFGECIVIGVLADQEAGVLAEREGAGFELDTVDPVGCECDRYTQQLRERGDHRLQGRLGRDLTFLRTPEVRHHQHRRAGIECHAQCR